MSTIISRRPVPRRRRVVRSQVFHWGEPDGEVMVALCGYTAPKPATTLKRQPLGTTMCERCRMLAVEQAGYGW